MPGPWHLSLDINIQIFGGLKVGPRLRGFTLQAVTSSFGEVLLSSRVVPCLRTLLIKLNLMMDHLTAQPDGWWPCPPGLKLFAMDQPGRRP